SHGYELHAQQAGQQRVEDGLQRLEVGGGHGQSVASMWWKVLRRPILRKPQRSYKRIAGFCGCTVSATCLYPCSRACASAARISGSPKPRCCQGGSSAMPSCGVCASTYASPTPSGSRRIQQAPASAPSTCATTPTSPALP